MKTGEKWAVGVVVGVIVIVGVVLAVVYLTKHTKSKAASTPNPSANTPNPSASTPNPSPVATKNPMLQRIVPVAKRVAAVPPGMVRTSISKQPVVDLIENFLTHEECDQLIALAEPKVTRSNVVSPQTGKYVPDPSRTSESMYFNKGENDLVKRIERKAAAVSGLPVENLEGLQVVRYKHGQFYKHHFDYFAEDNAEIKTRGQRVLTIFGYLNTLPEEETGGGTDFPEIKHTFKPVKGSAALWHNVDENGKTDPRVLHAGQTISLPHTVKYGLNLWFRDRPW
jgi:prolyl 4-hydroxylase